MLRPRRLPASSIAREFALAQCFLELKADGHGILKIGRKLGIGTSVVQRVFKQGWVAT